MRKDLLSVTFTAREQAALVASPLDTTPLGPQEIVGRTLYTLVSAGTELNGAYLGERFPRTPGYAAVFVVEAVGAAVTTVKIGDRRFCMGPHCSYQRVTVQESLPVPPGVPSEWAPFARLMGVTMATLTTTPARPPELVLVTGLGPVGHLGAQLFQACGYRVIAVDPDANRQAITQQVGVVRVYSAVPVDDPAVAGQVALHLECSGHEQAALDGCKVLKKGGELAQVAAPWSRRTSLYAHELLRLVFFNYLTVRSGWEWELPLHATPFRTNSIWGNFAAALEWLAARRVNVGDLFELVEPGAAQQVYQDLLYQRTEALAQVFDWQRLSD